MPVHDNGSLHQMIYEPCVPLSRNSLTWAQHLNELHAQWTVVFHMAEWPIDTLSLIYLAVMALTFKRHFNGSYVLISDSPRMLLPGPSSCPVWWPQHCLSPFTWRQVSLISYLNCIIAKIFSWIKPKFCPPVGEILANRLLQNKTDILLPLQLNHTGCWIKFSEHQQIQET